MELTSNNKFFGKPFKKSNFFHFCFRSGKSRENEKKNRKKERKLSEKVNASENDK